MRSCTSPLAQGVRPSIQDPALYAAVNVLGTTVLLDAARAAKVSRLVIASSSSVYGNEATPPFREDDPAIRPISPYAATKRAAELMCQTYAELCDWMRIISLRFFTVYGPRQRPDLAIHSFTRKIMAGEPVPFFGDGTAERDYTYVTDTVQGVLGAIDRTRTVKPGHEIFNLGESAVTSLVRRSSVSSSKPSAGAQRSSGFRRSPVTCAARLQIFPGRDSTWDTRRRCR